MFNTGLHSYQSCLELNISKDERCLIPSANRNLTSFKQAYIYYERINSGVCYESNYHVYIIFANYDGLKSRRERNRRLLQCWSTEKKKPLWQNFSMENFTPSSVAKK